jgi:DNA (cytosine-5)-methyltransferase 1
MKVHEQISIEDFGSKPSKLKLIDELDNEKAVITHYLHNIQNGVAKHYKETAENYLASYISKNFPHQDISEVRGIAIEKLRFEMENVPFQTPESPTFKFIDLFAGVGGFRIAMQNVGGKCVFTSEWNVDAQKTYRENYGEVPFGDITKHETKNFIPDKFDILCAGFPCQAFSIAGYQKGFSDTRGTLFFDLEQIIERKRPKVIFLENVKNLQSHDGGNTFRTMVDVLENKLNYKIRHGVLNSMTHANVPQNRERIFIVGFDPKQVEKHGEFKFPDAIPLTRTIHDILEEGKQDDCFYYKKDHMYYPELEKTMTSRDTVYQWRRVYVRENKSNVCPTLTANMGAGGHNVPLILDDYGIRKLTPRECFSFQGYPKNFVLPNLANSKLYMQAGNSVTTPLIELISKQIIKVL